MNTVFQASNTKNASTRSIYQPHRTRVHDLESLFLEGFKDINGEKNMKIPDGIIQGFIFSTLGIPLLWYLKSRWKYLCSGYTIFFVLCETLVLLIGFLNMHILIEGTRKYFLKIKPIDETMTSDAEKIWYHLSLLEKLPTILIIVPTYQEGVTCLERTLLAVNRIEYPKYLIQVVIGDDGNSPEVKEFVKEKFPAMIYHCREKIFGHAKAGNINDILFAGTDSEDHPRYLGDYVLILDCDMAPIPDILSNLLPLFYKMETFEKDEKCCFVQSPQEFCNIRGIDFLGQNYNFFYKVVLRAYGGYELGVPCCGTNVLFDRYHLSTIGGMQYGSITEDFKTSLALHAHGLHSRFYPKTTAIGFAPTSLLDFYHQRERWSIGGLQIVFDKNYWSQFIKLPLVYQWIYTFSGLSPMVSFLMGVLLMGPIMDMMNHNIFLCGMSNQSYLFFFMPYICIYITYLLFLHRGLSWPILILSMQESIFMIPFQARFFFMYLIRTLGIHDISFRITPKTTSYHRYKNHHWDLFFLLVPYLVYFALVGYSFFLANQYYEHILVDEGWLIFIMIQLINPFCYVFQNSFF